MGGSAKIGIWESSPHSGGEHFRAAGAKKIGFFGRFLAVFRGKTENFRPPEAAGPKMTPPPYGGGLFSQILGFGGSGGDFFQILKFGKSPP